jgi:hypothetical protein
LKSSSHQRLEIIKTRRSGLFIKKRSALFLGKAHSINKGLWGTSVGGKKLNVNQPLPNDATLHNYKKEGEEKVT